MFDIFILRDGETSLRIEAETPVNLIFNLVLDAFAPFLESQSLHL